MRTLIILVLLLSAWFAFSQADLRLGPQDIVIERALENGYHLWIRKKLGIESVLITESSADPAKREHSYALRAPTYNDVNGREKRLLDGEFLDADKGLYSLIDSTPDLHQLLGRAFHIYVPSIVIYGYPWSRAGEIVVGDGSFLNIRAFSKPFGDYTGQFQDNPFLVRVTATQREFSFAALGPEGFSPDAKLSPPRPAEQPSFEDLALNEPVARSPENRFVSPQPIQPTLVALRQPPPGVRELRLATPQPIEAPVEGEYDSEAVEKLTEIADEGGGQAFLSPGKQDMVDRIGALIGEETGETLDMVLALDTTRSMLDDMLYLQDLIVPLLEKQTAGFSRFRIGLLLYRDYMEEYLVKPLPFHADLGWVQNNIDSVRVEGGRDIPEAVYEALYSGIHSYTWEADSRLIILIGDAPPHPQPRGKVTPEMVYADAKDLGIKINTIIIPQTE